jgi:hypothetical protein
VAEADRNIWGWPEEQLRAYLLAGSDLHRKFLFTYERVELSPLNAHSFLCLTEQSLCKYSVLPAHRAEVFRVAESLRTHYFSYARQLLNVENRADVAAWKAQLQELFTGLLSLRKNGMVPPSATSLLEEAHQLCESDLSEILQNIRHRRRQILPPPSPPIMHLIRRLPNLSM